MRLKNLLIIGLVVVSLLVGNQAYAQYDNTTVFRMSEVVIITERHSMSAAQNLNGEISLTWKSPVTLTVNEIIVPEEYRTWFTFSGTPFMLASEENIRYSLETPRQFCDQLAGITIDCIDQKTILKIPIIISIQYKTTTFDTDSEIIIDLRDQNTAPDTETPLTLAVVGGGIMLLLAVVYFEKTKKRKIHF